MAQRKKIYQDLDTDTISVIRYTQCLFTIGLYRRFVAEKRKYKVLPDSSLKFGGESKYNVYYLPIFKKDFYSYTNLSALKVSTQKEGYLRAGATKSGGLRTEHKVT